MSTDWRSAFLRQANSDFKVALHLMQDKAGSAARCHTLHYLQMALEKLSKGYMMPPGSSEVIHSHQGATRLIQVLIPRSSINAALHAALGKTGANVRKSYMKSLLPTISAIERLAPSLSQAAPNAEYPWPMSNGVQIIAPADYAFDEDELSEPKILKVIALLKVIFRFLEETGALK